MLLHQCPESGACRSSLVLGLHFFRTGPGRAVMAPPGPGRPAAPARAKPPLVHCKPGHPVPASCDRTGHRTGSQLAGGLGFGGAAALIWASERPACSSLVSSARANMTPRNPEEGKLKHPQIGPCHERHARYPRTNSQFWGKVHEIPMVNWLFPDAIGEPVSRLLLQGPQR